MRAARCAPAATAAQIAVVLGCHPSTVRKHLSSRLALAGRSVAVAQSATRPALTELMRVRVAAGDGPASRTIERALARSTADRTLAAQSPGAGVGWLTERLAGDRDWGVRTAAAGSAAASTWLLRRCAAHPDSHLAYAAGSNTAAPPAVHAAAARSRNRWLRARAAALGAGRPAALARCCSDADPGVRAGAAECVSLPEMLRRRLRRDPDLSVAATARRIA